MLHFLAQLGMATFGAIVLLVLFYLALVFALHILGLILAAIVSLALIVLLPLMAIFEPFLVGFGLMQPTEIDD